MIDQVGTFVVIDLEVDWRGMNMDLMEEAVLLNTLFKSELVTHSVKRLTCHTMWGRGALHPRLQSHHCLYMCSMWTENSSATIVCWQWNMQARVSALALKPSADITRSPQQGFSDPQNKDSCPPKYLQKSYDFFYWMKDAIRLYYKEIEKDSFGEI